SKTNPLFQDTRSFTSPLYGRTSNLPGTVNVGSSSPGAILAPALSSPSQTNPTGTAATATSVNQLIANGTYLATTPGAVAGAFDARTAGQGMGPLAVGNRSRLQRERFPTERRESALQAEHTPGDRGRL